MSKDTIYRQDAIDAADEIIARDKSGNNDVVKAMTAWKEYIKDLPSAETVLTCNGCKHVGTYDTNFPCNRCVRREKDYYVPEQ